MHYKQLNTIQIERPAKTKYFNGSKLMQVQYYRFKNVLVLSFVDTSCEGAKYNCIFLGSQIYLKMSLIF